MQNITKLAIAAIAVSSIISANALADDIKTIVRCNHHGSNTIVYRDCDPSATTHSVGVYAQGQGVGNASAADSNGSPRLRLTENGHGPTRFQYGAE